MDSISKTISFPAQAHHSYRNREERPLYSYPIMLLAFGGLRPYPFLAFSALGVLSFIFIAFVCSV